MIVRGGIISMAVVTGRGDPYGSFLSLVPFRLAAPPLELEVGGGHIRYGVYDSPTICRWRELVVSRFLSHNR
jgi:hypothetical protein